MEILHIKKLISVHKLKTTNFVSFRDIFKKSVFYTCYYLCILMLFEKVELYVYDIQDFISFENWLKINYKGLYGWQKIQQIFLDNSSDFPSDVVEKIQSLSLPSTFEIPSNWTIYAPILR